MNLNDGLGSTYELKAPIFGLESSDLVSYWWSLCTEDLRMQNGERIGHT